MDKGSYLVFAQEFAQGSKKLNVSRTERIPRGSATDVHSDPQSFDPLRQLPDVEIYQETNRFLRVFLSVISILLTVKIFEACTDFLTPDGLGSCRKRRNFGRSSFTRAVMRLRLGRAGFSVVP